MSRTEILTRADGPPTFDLALGVAVRVMATGSLGAVGLTTSLVEFCPGAVLTHHFHPFSEVIVALSGQAIVQVENRRYRLHPYDAIHVPAGTPHALQNDSGDQITRLHSSFASESPARQASPSSDPAADLSQPAPAHPESLIRFASAPVYELAPGAHFRDLFASRFGSRGLCGGYGVFEPGASLPCHVHAYDESITIVSGQAISQIAGREYELMDCGTACIPQGRPHRFLNRSNQPMAMIWVYAGDEPERTLLDPAHCEGTK